MDRKLHSHILLECRRGPHHHSLPSRTRCIATEGDGNKRFKSIQFWSVIREYGFSFKFGKTGTLWRTLPLPLGPRSTLGSEPRKGQGRASTCRDLSWDEILTKPSSEKDGFRQRLRRGR